MLTRFAIAVALIVWGAVGAPGAAAEADRPNFVVILCDDLGYGDLGCYGHAKIRTPHLDRLASEGLRLTDCYSAAPICSPSRAGLLTGRTPARTGVYSWIAPGNPMQLPAREVTIATLLKSVGYDTCHVGKWHLNGRFNKPAHLQPDDHGFDHWFSTHNNAGPSHENPENFVRNGEPVGRLEGYSCQLVADEAIAWLRGRADPSRPFFQFVCFHEPHEPVASPPVLVDGYLDLIAADGNDRESAAVRDRATYYANVENVDIAVGRLLKNLDDLGVAENTLVLFTSDNGPETLSRYASAARSYGSPGPLRGMKLHLHEGGIRVPGIVRWPAVVEPGRTSDEPVASLDLLPTCCELAGVEPPQGVPLDGQSLVGFLRGEPFVRERPLYWHYYGGIGNRQVGVRSGRWKLVAGWNGAANMPAGATLRPGEVTQMRASDLTTFELYDLSESIDESLDQSIENPDELATLREFARRTYRESLAEGADWEFPVP